MAYRKKAAGGAASATVELGWDALGDPTRRLIFRRVAEAPASVADLAKGLPVSRPAVSQHLKTLKDAGLVTDRAEGTRRIYAVDFQGLARIRADLDAFWGDALERFKRVAEEAEASATLPAVHHERDTEEVEEKE